MEYGDKRRLRFSGSQEVGRVGLGEDISGRGRGSNNTLSNWKFSNKTNYWRALTDLKTEKLLYLIISRDMSYQKRDNNSSNRVREFVKYDYDMQLYKPLSLS